MAISVRSTLSEEERIFTIALDRCEADGVDGMLYHTASHQGWHFGNFLELTDAVEQIFGQNRYPGEVLKKRFFGSRKNRTKLAAIQVSGEHRARREGAAATYLLRVRQRHNASWQGSLINRKSGQRFVFRSFLELIEQLDSCAEMTKIQNSEKFRQITERYLPLALTEQKSWPCVQEILPGVVLCQMFREGRRNTFLVRILFFENHTCQGVLHWKEKNCQQSFRSFLELIHLMGDVVLEECQVEGTAG